LAIIGGLHGNMNMNADDLRRAVDSMESNFEEAVATIYGRRKAEEVPIEENPFFGAMKLPKVEMTDEDRRRLAGEVEVEVDQS
jgi:hypothetical protein